MDDLLFENVSAFIGNEPTNSELVCALNISKQIGSVVDLKRIRARRYSWLGKEECVLRMAIDHEIANMPNV